MKKHLKRGIVLLAVIILFATVAFYIMPRKAPKGVFQTTGILEATEVNLAPRISERVKEVRFHEGDRVKDGEVVVVLDDRKEKAQFEQAQADLEVAKANVLNADANIEKAKVKIEDTERDLGRYGKLLEKKLVAQNDVDKAKTAYDTAVADLNGMVAQKILAEATIKQSEAALKVAKTNLDDTVIYSTLSGMVVLRAFEPGEMASNGATILTIIDLSDVWVRVDVEETAVSKIKLGDIAKVKVDSLPGWEFKGRVTEINSEGEFATQRDVKRGRQDIKTFRVKVKIDEPEGLLKQGMTATATFGG
ncbi:MAG: efflux RND transporter periplasmic adaptor subunit [Candidatus Omnitrophica bacterium]|nr:efflux RND transporter periplasmic adaptor subunit [Candidatus Omnitrophota bacterium]